MTKEEQKKMNEEARKKQLELEKEFHKTPGGKLLRALLYIAVIVLVFGLLLAFSYNIFDLEESIRDFAGNCIKFGGGVSLFCSFFYSIWLPMFNEEEKVEFKWKKKK